MGSKATMLDGQLGVSLIDHLSDSSRFIDLFSGTGTVAKYVATRVKIPVVAVDQMSFPTLLSSAVLNRTSKFNGELVFARWHAAAVEMADGKRKLLDDAKRLSSARSKTDVLNARKLARRSGLENFLWRDYAGYYFSPVQAFWLSIFYETRPKRGTTARSALAALVSTASRASASPGHTAQPFQPTASLLPHIRAAWRVDVQKVLKDELISLGTTYALTTGRAVVGDAVAFIRQNIRDGDVVFCDPPYSEAQYSRFYHVLESIARGGWVSVGGAGRAPALDARVRSKFSSRRESVEAFEELLGACLSRRCKVMITYPEGVRSNGLTIGAIEELAAGNFAIAEQRIAMRHSTLGGSSLKVDGRSGRKDLYERLIVLQPLDPRFRSSREES